jgi:hypothetical protein
MKSLTWVFVGCSLLLASIQALADDVVTNIMSPIVSYQAPEDFNSQALTNGGISGPIVSYQYFEWPGDDVLHLNSSPWASYYYQFLDAPPLNIVATSRIPTTSEVTPQLAALPTTSQLLAYHGGIFTPNLISVDIRQPTIVLSHGWIPLNPLTGHPVFTPNGVDDWPTRFAAQLRANGVTANIVAFDWGYVARSDVNKPGIPEQETGDQGQILGQLLLVKFGPSYAQPIQFIGHSLGTLVNGTAANYLHGDRWAKENASTTPWDPANTLMTLFDEAEVARGVSSFGADIDTLAGRNGNPFTPSRASDHHPLPKRCAWAENYIAAFGLLQTNAVNVILTNRFPANAKTALSWFDELGAFHGYPMDWYNETIQTDNSAMGFVWPLLWSFRDPAFSDAPIANSIYIQASRGSEWDLSSEDWNYATSLLAARFQAYRNGLYYSLKAEAVDSAKVNGIAIAESVLLGVAPVGTTFVISLFTTPANTPLAPQKTGGSSGPSPDDAGGSTNMPAYAWISLFVPSNAVSMSFDYKIEGDWSNDFVTAAFNGTNVLFLPGSQIETNILFSSGSIDVSAITGQTNEFFIGVVGGTSTNAVLAVENLAFALSFPPSLQAQLGTGGLVLSWPLSAQDFSLQTTTNVADSGSWVALTNVPAVTDLQNVVTNGLADDRRFYRLKR